MSEFELASICIAAGALVLSFVSLGFSIRVHRDNKKLSSASAALHAQALALQHGDLELSLRAMIGAAQARFFELSERHGSLLSRDPEKLNSQDRAARDRSVKLIEAAQEAVVNAYEEACSKYRDGKVDKVRFKKSYQREVRQLYEDKNHNQLFNNSSRFGAIIAVYREWEDKEA